VQIPITTSLFGWSTHKTQQTTVSSQLSNHITTFQKINKPTTGYYCHSYNYDNQYDAIHFSFIIYTLTIQG